MGNEKGLTGDTERASYRLTIGATCKGCGGDAHPERPMTHVGPDGMCGACSIEKVRGDFGDHAADGRANSLSRSAFLAVKRERDELLRALKTTTITLDLIIAHPPASGFDWAAVRGVAAMAQTLIESVET